MLRDRTTERRSAEIHAYTGMNGGGKSMAMVQDTIPSLLAGRPVLSTVRLIDPDHRDGVPTDEALDAWAQLGITRWSSRHLPTYLPHPLYRPLTRWVQLIDFEYGDVLFDEVLGVANSRQHMSLPPAVQNLIHQLRRDDCMLRWTSPSYQRADAVLREITQAITYCNGFMGKKIEGRMWKSNRAYLWRTYDAKAVNEWEPGDREKDDAPPAMVRQLARFSKLTAYRFYDSFAPVDHITDADESGTCLHCGGHRRRPRCECPAREEPQRSEDRTAPDPEPVAA